AAEPPPALAQRFRYAGDGPLLALAAGDQAKLPELARGQLLLAEEDANGKLLHATGLQLAGLLDDLYAKAADAPALGATHAGQHSTYRLWAPTAQRVQLCTYAGAQAKSDAVLPMQADAVTGVWTLARPAYD